MTPTEEQQFEDLDRTFVPPMRRLPDGTLLIKINEEDIQYLLYGSGINKTRAEFVILGFGAVFLVLIIVLFWRSGTDDESTDEM